MNEHKYEVSLSRKSNSVNIKNLNLFLNFINILFALTQYKGGHNLFILPHFLLKYIKVFCQVFKSIGRIFLQLLTVDEKSKKTEIEHSFEN